MNTRLYNRPGQLIGHRRDGRPIYLLAGGSADAGIEVGDGSTDETETDDAADGGKYTPPSRAEWLKVQNALSKSNASAKQRREALAEANRVNAELQAAQAQREADDERRALLAAQTPPTSADDGAGRKGKKAGGGGAGAPATVPVLPDGVLTKAQVKQLTIAAAKEAEERAADRFRSQVVNQAARAALMDAGMSRASASKMVKTLDLDLVEVDDDGEITGGMEEQVEELKADLPQLFKPAEPEKKRPTRAPVPKAGAAGKADTEDLPGSSAERMARQILGTR